ncbi:MAG: hypothetical protein INR64_05140 [Caulobacteraceae bacterium]|nr:hypothetical protein [Caulobacter sp.]
MTFRPAPLATAALAGLALGACHPKPMGHVSRSPGVHVSTVEPTAGAITVAARLTCPQSEGGWNRTAQAADGMSCSYAGEKGRVDLALLSGAPGDAQAILAPERARLDALMPSAKDAAVQVVDERGPDGRKVEKVDLPFLHVRRDGEHKSVQIMGFHVDKTGHDDGDGDDDDRAASPVAGAGTKLVYILAGARPAPGGWHAVGYDARVDATGRAVVASFRYAKGEHTDDADEDGLDQLIAPNVTTAAPARATANTADQ